MGRLLQWPRGATRWPGGCRLSSVRPRSAKVRSLVSLLGERLGSRTSAWRCGYSGWHVCSCTSRMVPSWGVERKWSSHQPHWSHNAVPKTWRSSGRRRSLLRDNPYDAMVLALQKCCRLTHACSSAGAIGPLLLAPHHLNTRASKSENGMALDWGQPVGKLGTATLARSFALHFAFTSAGGGRSSRRREGPLQRRSSKKLHGRALLWSSMLSQWKALPLARTSSVLDLWPPLPQQLRPPH